MNEKKNLNDGLRIISDEQAKEEIIDYFCNLGDDETDVLNIHVALNITEEQVSRICDILIKEKKILPADET